MTTSPHPSPLTLPAGTHALCTCGLSQNGAFCDASHQGCGQSPRILKLEEEQTIDLCTCGTSANKPFCDGSHQRLSAPTPEAPRPASPNSPSLEHHETFAIFAETLSGWRNPATAEGAELLAQHYAWAREQHASGALLFAGPIDVEALAPGAPTPVGKVSGVLVLRAASRAAAEAIAQSDPFHSNGCRHNAVHSWSIRFAQQPIAAALAAALADHQAS
jgi:CDGSH-type Zn-finger protein/uncharacterized protein YciI